MYDVIALGELLVDLAERSKDEAGYPTLAANPGGAPGNFLAALSAYGKKTAFLAKVGDDTFGRLLVGTMQRAGIDGRGIEELRHLYAQLDPIPRAHGSAIFERGGTTTTSIRAPRARA